MKNYIFYCLLAFTLILLSSCEKVISLNTGNKTGDLVIEANITNIEGPQLIKLSTNTALSNTNNYPPVTGAQVSLSDQSGNVFKFSESTAGTYTIDRLAAKSGVTYTMHVLSNGKDYTANSVMPELVPLDSISSSKDEFGNKDLRKITVHYHDPAGVVNQYKFNLFVNGVQVKSIFANNDDFTDGNQVSLVLRQDDIDIHAGDQVSVEMQCIDKLIYTYWFTLMRQSPDGPGGGVTPANPPTNISPVTLGYFSAHTTSSKTILVK